MARNATEEVTLGIWIRDRRTSLRMSQDDLAAAARVSRSTIHRLERDVPPRPGAEKLAQVLAALGCTEAEIQEAMAAEDPILVADVVHWRARANAFVNVATVTGSATPLARLAGDPDNAPAFVATKHPAVAEVRGQGLEELKTLLKENGWMVMVPEA